MNDTVATKVQDTLTSATSPELAVVIGTRTVEYHQGQRSYTAPTGRTYDRSRPKRSERRNPLAKRPWAAWRARRHCCRFRCVRHRDSGQTRPARQRVTDRLGDGRFAGDGGELGLEPRLHRFEDRLGAGMPHRPATIRAQAADFALDGVEGADARERLGGDRRRRRGLDFEELRRTCAQQNASLAWPLSASAL